MYFFSTELRKLYLQWAKSEPGVAIADYYSLFSKLMDKPERYGFSRKYLKQGCIGRRCSDNWREYIWFDDVGLLLFLAAVYWLLTIVTLQYHPTTYVHSLMADEAMEALDNVLWWNSARRF